MAKILHPMHQVALDASDWITTMANAVAEGMHDGDRPPFGADVPDRDRLAYYADRFYNPDGSPNEQNRQAEIQRIGPEGYARVLIALEKQRGRLLPGAPVTPPSQEASYG